MPEITSKNTYYLQPERPEDMEKWLTMPEVSSKKAKDHPTVEHEGRSYVIHSARLKKYGAFKRFGRGLLGVGVTGATLGLGLISKRVRKLFTKPGDKVFIAVFQDAVGKTGGKRQGLTLPEEAMKQREAIVGGKRFDMEKEKFSEDSKVPEKVIEKGKQAQAKRGRSKSDPRIGEVPKNVRDATNVARHRRGRDVETP